jgi:hypothetical protein
LQFLLHLPVWRHFNGMWFMGSCVYWIIWILKFLIEPKNLWMSKFGLNKRFLTYSFNNITFTKAP